MIHTLPPGAAMPVHTEGDTIELQGGAAYPLVRVKDGVTVRAVGGSRAVVAGVELSMRSGVTLSGLHVKGEGAGDGLVMIGPGRDVWADDCLFTDWTNGANVNGHDGDRIGGGFRRCIFRNMTLDGIFLGKFYKGGLYENNWFEGCGDKWWYAGESTDSSNVYRGNIGIGKPGMTGGFVCRAGGLIEHNVAYGCDLGIAVGIKSWTGAPPTATIRNNLILAGIGRCIGISLCATKDVRLTRNLIAHAVGGGMIARALSQETDDRGVGCVGTVEEGTIIHDWSDSRVSGDPLQALYTSRGSPMPVQEGVRGYFSRGGGWVVAA
jgi:hypothetical protein